ncbi:MAG: hypothetical protein DLM52_08010 [Chthoniobacterales bacterium]|nr:MAG: hypothetical protein DLM52_08010 [Chthoniobacterales bacterium]
MRIFCVAGVLLPLILGLALAAGGNDAIAARPARLFFESGGRKIRADVYSPAVPKSMCAIVLLHGAGGMLFDGPRMRRVARALAGAGDTVYLLHYFNRTATIAARDPEMQARFEDWLGTVRDGIKWVHDRADEGERPIGIYGYSLGAFLAIAAASNNPLVGAVTEQAGGMWNSQENRVSKMPPVLMVHGMGDERVPFEKYAKPLLRVLRERSGKVETDFVPGEGHVFSEAAMKTVRPKAAKFFGRELSAARDGR